MEATVVHSSDPAEAECEAATKSPKTYWERAAKRRKVLADVDGAWFEAMAHGGDLVQSRATEVEDRPRARDSPDPLDLLGSSSTSTIGTSADHIRPPAPAEAGSRSDQDIDTKAIVPSSATQATALFSFPASAPPPRLAPIEDPIAELDPAPPASPSSPFPDMQDLPLAQSPSKPAKASQSSCTEPSLDEPNTPMHGVQPDTRSRTPSPSPVAVQLDGTASESMIVDADAPSPSPDARPDPAFSPRPKPLQLTFDSSPLPSPSEFISRAPVVAPSSSSSARSRSPSLTPVRAIAPEEPVAEDDASVAARLAAETEAAGGRTFRKRTMAQMNPYMYDQLRYAKRLTDNQWEDAIVALPKPKNRDENDRGPDRPAREEERDDLDGWLDLEDGADRGEGGSGWKGLPAEASESSSEEEEEEEEELDDDDIGILPERRHAKPRRPKGASTKPNKPRARPRPEFDDINISSQAPTRRRPSAPSTASVLKPKKHSLDPSLRGVTVAGGGGLHRGPLPRKRRTHADYGSASEETESDGERDRTVRAGSEPLSSPRKGLAKRRKRQSSAPVVSSSQESSQPTKHRRSTGGQRGSSAQKRPTRRADSDDDSDIELVDATRSTSKKRKYARLRSRSRSRSVTIDDLGPSKKMQGKRKKALRAMMPGAFFKKAQIDLEKMAREREEGAWSGSDGGSGDQETESSGGEETRGMPKAKIRRMSRDWNEPPRLAHLLHDDAPSSGDDDVLEDALDQEDEDEGGQVAHWLALMAPGKNRKRSDAIDQYLSRGKASGTGRKSTVAAPKTAGGATTSRAPLKDKPRAVNGAKDTGGQGERSAKAKKRSSDKQSKLSEHFERPISLLDDHALWGTVEASNGVPGLGLAPPALRAQKPTLAHDSGNLRSYAAFKDFSPDFGIARLPAGISFTPFSYIANGFLQDLVSIKAGVVPKVSDRSCLAFDTHLEASMGTELLVDLLPVLNDQLQDELNAWLALDHGKSDQAIRDAATYLRFVGLFVSEHDGEHCAQTGGCFFDIAASTTKDLIERLDDLAIDKVNRPDFSRLMLVIAWGALEIALRLFLRPCLSHGDGPVRPGKLVERILNNVVRRLLEWGLDHTMKRLKAVADPGCEEPQLDDPSAEIWVCLINLAVSASRREHWPTCLSPLGLWNVIYERIRRHTALVNLPPVAAGEAMSYGCIGICALSQFAADGSVQASPQMPPFWPALLYSLDPVKPEQLGEAVDLTAEWRRDRYLWCLFARCLVFADVWGWTLDFDSGLLAKLYAVLNARRLERLSHEQGSDYPPVLQSPPSSADLSLVKTDTAFSIFLKVLYGSVRAIKLAPKQKEQRVLRELMKMSPVRQFGFTPGSAVSARARSGVVNHYALFIAYMQLCPTSANQQMSKLKNVCKFETADNDSRKIFIGMLLQVAAARRRLDMDSKPVLDILASTMLLVRKQHSDLEKSRQQKGASSGKPASSRVTSAQELAHERAVQKAAMDAIVKQMSSRALELCAIMRAVQHITRSGCQPATAGAVPSYPDLALLNRVWTSDILDSPLALDPLIGDEVVNVLRTFLDCRDAALPKRARPDSDPSQDDYGDFEADIYNDPNLNALLGVGDTANAVPSNGVQERDREFAELARYSLSPACYRVLSNVFNSASSAAGSVLLLKRKLGFAHILVDCWTRFAHAAVSHRLKEWRAYVLFGDECFMRIPDLVGRREIGMAFVSRMLELDPGAYQSVGEDLLNLWWEVIVASDLTIQHVFTSHILHFEHDSPVYQGHTEPFASASQLEAQRVPLLRDIFSRMNRALFVIPRNQIAKSVHAGHVSTMAKAMSDQYRACDSVAKPAYARFCWQVMEAMQQVAGQTLTVATVSALRMVEGVAERGKPVFAAAAAAAFANQ